MKVPTQNVPYFCKECDTELTDEHDDVQNKLCAACAEHIERQAMEHADSFMNDHEQAFRELAK